MATALQEVFARFGIDFDREGNLPRGRENVDGAIESLRTMAQTVAGGFAFQWARDFVRGTVEMGDALDDTSAAIGISTREIQEWQHVARLSGVEAGEFTSSFVRLQNRMAQGGAGAEVFRRLGVDIRDSNGQLRNASDVLTDLADPIAAIGSDAERTGVLVDLLGRSGARLGPLFERGSAGISEVRAELATLGGGMSEEAVAASADLADAWVRLDVVSLSFRSKLATLLLPILEWMSRGIATLTNNSRILEGVLVALGIASAQLAVSTAATWGPLALNAARVLLPLIAIALVVEDLIVLFEGGESVIGDVLDALGGDGTQLEFVAAMNEGWGRLVENLRFARDFWVDMFGGETAVGEATAGGEQRVATRGGPNATGGGVSLEQDVRRDVVTADIFASDAEVEQRVAARLASMGVRSGGAAPARGVAQTVTNSITIERIDASGLDEAAATRVAERAVRGALEAQAADSLDTLARGSVQ